MLIERSIDLASTLCALHEAHECLDHIASEAGTQFTGFLLDLRDQLALRRLPIEGSSHTLRREEPAVEIDLEALPNLR